MIQYRNLSDYCDATGRKKYHVAEELKVSRFQMTALLHPGRYPVTIDDDLAKRIARLLNQSPRYVRHIYGEAA